MLRSDRYGNSTVTIVQGDSLWLCTIRRYNLVNITLRTKFKRTLSVTACFQGQVVGPNSQNNVHMTILLHSSWTAISREQLLVGQLVFGYLSAGQLHVVLKFPSLSHSHASSITHQCQRWRWTVRTSFFLWLLKRRKRRVRICQKQPVCV